MITIQKASITDLTTDAIVNAANTHLKAGSGVCGAIFSAAGKTQLQAACDAIGYCPVGSAVITPGFNTHSKYIIHAVGPKWNGGDPNSALYSAYKRALQLATEHGCASVGFPLISAGVYGYPVDKAWQEAVRAGNFLIFRLFSPYPNTKKPGEMSGTHYCRERYGSFPGS